MALVYILSEPVKFPTDLARNIVCVPLLEDLNILILVKWAQDLVFDDLLKNLLHYYV